MSAKNIESARGRLFRNPQKFHMHFLHPAPAFAMIAVRTGSYYVRPDMQAAHMAWCYMIHSETALALSAILAGIIIPPKDLAACQLDVGTRAMNLVLQPDH